jgi:hypothetical protein
VDLEGRVAHHGEEDPLAVEEAGDGRRSILGASPLLLPPPNEIKISLMLSLSCGWLTRDRDRQRQTETDRERETERDRDRGTRGQRHRERERHTETDLSRWMDRGVEKDIYLLTENSDSLS